MGPQPKAQSLKPWRSCGKATANHLNVEVLDLPLMVGFYILAPMREARGRCWEHVGLLDTNRGFLNGLLNASFWAG